MDEAMQRYDRFMIGVDVGSTTVKVVVIRSETGDVVWKGYRRHETRQPESLLDFLDTIHERFDLHSEKARIFITGSGGSALAPLIGARFVQEVNAVSLAVERLHPRAGSIIELGGQDAKIIIWAVDEETGKRVKLPSMNDKCAGGTGAVIDKIGAKLGFDQRDLQLLTSDGVRLHQVAGRCGVFAETDINSLQKQGVPAEELMNSLFEAIVQQNLSVLARGNTILPEVLLLGGPHTFIPALAEAWRRNIPRVWEERGVVLPAGSDPAALIKVPEDSQYFAALGALFFGMGEEEQVGLYRGRDELIKYIEERGRGKDSDGEPGFFRREEERREFERRYGITCHGSAIDTAGGRVGGYIGIDGGSTSTKGVILDERGEVMAKAYRLSAGNPLEDTKRVVRELRRQVESAGVVFDVLGVGTTGYAKDMLREALQADVAVVETVAHTKSALRYFDDVDVICDVGGQDIKVILLDNGRVKDFKLNTQCSAGNGYFLQNTARQFGYDIGDYADAAFTAARVPVFNYGCAVFLESDIVNFQQQGWGREEILAGLAMVLPKNIWLYVVQEPNLRKLGRRFVLQGGTQRNLAAVKAQYDYIKSRVTDADILVHPHTGESGAIGAALEAMTAVAARSTRFIGFEALDGLTFSASRDEETRCLFCRNRCMRTFIDLSLREGTSRRYIIAPCEKGAVEGKDEMRSVRERLETIKRENPDLSRFAADEAFRKPMPPVNKGDRAGPTGGRSALDLMASLFSFRGGSPAAADSRKADRQPRIGIPRVLNIYSTAPFFVAYFRSIGLDPGKIVFSDFTDEEMFKEGSRRGSIDQCFPSKAALAHVHNLLYRKDVDVIFFPILINLPSKLEGTLDSLACPTVQATPDVCKAAFLREKDIFAEMGVRYVEPVLNLAEPELLEKQMFDCFRSLLGISRGVNRRGMEAGFRAVEAFIARQQEKGRDILRMLEREDRVGIVLLGRPYHNDPGLNHGIIEEIQKRGYPILTIDSLPVDGEVLERLFGDEVKEGEISSPMDISDVWKNSYSENSSRKIWGAKYVARHPNLVALDLSNFKCGHDSPIYSVVEDILHMSGTPYFTFHDIDENRPSGSIKIRVETIDYFLKQYRKELRKRESSRGVSREDAYGGERRFSASL